MPLGRFDETLEHADEIPDSRVAIDVFIAVTPEFRAPNACSLLIGRLFPRRYDYAGSDVGAANIDCEHPTVAAGLGKRKKMNRPYESGLVGIFFDRTEFDIGAHTFEERIGPANRHDANAPPTEPAANDNFFHPAPRGLLHKPLDDFLKRPGEILYGSQNDTGRLHIPIHQKLFQFSSR